MLSYSEDSPRDRPKLQTLSCSLTPVLGKGWRTGPRRLVDVLPPRQRELIIRQDSQCWLAEDRDQVIQMLAQKNSVVPRLERLAVDMGWSRSELVVDELTVVCEAAGVGFLGRLFCWWVAGLNIAGKSHGGGD